MYRKPEIKKETQNLRRQGKTFGEIQNAIKLKIPKSTLSNWCKNIPLPVAYQERLNKINYINLRKGKMAAIQRSFKIKKRLTGLLKNKNKRLLRIINKDVGKLLLSVLYLGEGAKRPGSLMLGSSDVNIIKLFLRLLMICYGIDKNLAKCRISYRVDQSINTLTQYWSKAINIPVKNFYKTIPDPRTLGRKTGQAGYKGVCVVYILKSSKIQLELKIISEILMGL